MVPAKMKDLWLGQFTKFIRLEIFNCQNFIQTFGMKLIYAFPEGFLLYIYISCDPYFIIYILVY